MATKTQMGKYKVSDRVRVLPLEKISALYYNRVNLPSGVAFVSQMNGYCGEELRVKEMMGPRHTLEGTVGLYKLEHLDGRKIIWTFTDEMLEDIDGINAPLHISMSFEDLLR
jgi:hypothetical protein